MGSQGMGVMAGSSSHKDAIPVGKSDARLFREAKQRGETLQNLTGNQ